MKHKPIPGDLMTVEDDVDAGVYAGQRVRLVQHKGTYWLCELVYPEQFPGLPTQAWVKQTYFL